MEIEYGLVADYLFAWGVSRAKAAGDAVGAITDKAFQVTLTRLETVVRNRLGTGNAALQVLQEETATAVAVPAADGATPASPAPEALSTETHGALVFSLKHAVKNDPDFANALAEALAAVQAADPEGAEKGERPGGITFRGNIETTGNQSPGIVGNNSVLSFGDYTAAPAAPSAGPAGRQPARPAGEENGGAEAGPTRPGTGHS